MRRTHLPPAALGKDRVEVTAERIAAGVGGGYGGEPEPDHLLFTAADGDLIMGRRFCSDPGWIDRLLLPVYHEVVDSIFDVGARIGVFRKEPALLVSFSVKRRGTFPSQYRRYVPSLECTASIVLIPAGPSTCLSIGFSTVSGNPPRPVVAKPERGKHVQRRPPPVRGWPR